MNIGPHAINLLIKLSLINQTSSLRTGDVGRPSTVPSEDWTCLRTTFYEDRVALPKTPSGLKNQYWTKLTTVLLKSWDYLADWIESKFFRFTSTIVIMTRLYREN